MYLGKDAKSKALIQVVKQLCIEIIQFQSVIIFIYSSITANNKSILYQPEGSDDWKKFDEIVETIPITDLKEKDLLEF